MEEAYPTFVESLEGPPKAPKQPSAMNDSEYLSLCLSLKSKCKGIFEKYIGFAAAPKILARRPSPANIPSAALKKKESPRSSFSSEDKEPKGQTAVEFLSNLPRRISVSKRLSVSKKDNPSFSASAALGTLPVQTRNENHLKIPDAIYKPLMAARESEVYHPNIFTRVYDYFYTQIENKAWEGYEKYVDPAGINNTGEDEGMSFFSQTQLLLNDPLLSSDHKITIKQLAMDELPSPFSYLDYSNFLQTQVLHLVIFPIFLILMFFSLALC